MIHFFLPAFSVDVKISYKSKGKLSRKALSMKENIEYTAMLAKKKNCGVQNS